MSVTTLTPRQQEIVEEYKEKLVSGHTLALAAASHRSRYGYMPPLERRDYARAVGTLAKMAQQSDPLAQIAAAAIPRLNLYGDRAQLCAAVYEAAASAVRDGFDDVIGRAGPEAGRFSDHQHRYTLEQIVAIHYWILDCFDVRTYGSLTTPGWCLQAIAEEIGYRHPVSR